MNEGLCPLCMAHKDSLEHWMLECPQSMETREQLDSMLSGLNGYEPLLARLGDDGSVTIGPQFI